MPCCSVVYCKNRSLTKNYVNHGITYHIFPKDANLKKEWIDATGRPPNWFPTKNSTICSVHFEAEMFQPLKKSRRLFEWAIPKLRLRLIFPEDSIEPITPGCADEKCIVSTHHLPRESNVLELYDHLKSPNEQSDEPSLKRKCINIQQKEDESQTLQKQDLKRADASDNIQIIETPRKRRMRIKITQKENLIKKQRFQIKRLQKKACRYRKKIANLKDILTDIHEQKFVNSEESAHLENLGVNDLIARYKSISNKNTIKTKYSPALRTFACTLHFYSPKAYEYVRKKFQTCLPHSRTIKKWYESVDAQPGFTQESFKALKCKARNIDYKLLCNLVLDEMAIRQRIEWDGKKMHGYVDICNKGTSGDYLAEAKEALVFLVTAINGSFKIPVGYFLVAGVTGEQRSSLVRQCLELLEETGIEVTSLTFDGCPANISMAKELGCSLSTENLKSHFPHPLTNKPIFIFPDPCHMLKLLRNAFEAYGIMVDDQGRHIKWCHLQQLNKIQEEEKLHLANKLRRGHIFFKNQKMKVRLASQLFSDSVADALMFCAERNMPKFRFVDGTANFLKIINNLFDILNSRNMMQLKFKKPLFPGNKQRTFEFLDRTETYINSLHLTDGSKLVQSGRKTGFIGFLVCIKSIKAIYIHLIEQEKRLQYLPAYKISQDHIELMFGHIRAHGGCNTNPTARQFQAIYKKLLVKSELRDIDKGNCTSLEEISFLTCSSAVQHINVTLEPRYNDESVDDDIDQLYEQAQFDEEVSMLVQDLSDFGSQAISYIAGFVVHSLIKTVKCETCTGALLADKYEETHNFIKLKDKGGLMYPSPDVVMICKRMEIIIKTACLTNDKLSVKTKNVKQELMIKALPHFVGLDLFDNIKFHQFEQSPMDNHLIFLIKAVMEKYINLRLNYLTKNATPVISKRQVLHKYLHFTGQ